MESVIKGLDKAEHEVDLIHLDRDEFNPRMNAEDLKAFVAHRQTDPQLIDFSGRLKTADHLIFIFPILWDIMPASTKGLIDRALSPGLVYNHHPRGFGLIPLLNNLKSITLITTMNKPRIIYTLLIGNLIRKVMVKSIFKTIGYKNVKWICYTSVKGVKYEKRQKWLKNIETKFSNF